MEQQKIDMFIGQHADDFEPSDIPAIKQRLESLDESKYFFITGQKYVEANMMLIIAILLGWERFWMDDIAMGVVKVITGYGCGIWWLIDIFSAKKRARKFNFNKFMQASQM